jgi:hypothetical protein
MRAGDTVLHKPTGEEWLVAYVEGDDLAWCGWPDGLARTGDCELVRACSDEEHVRRLRALAAADAGRRSRKAQIALESIGVAVIPTIDSVPSCGSENDYRRAKPVR